MCWSQLYLAIDLSTLLLLGKLNFELSKHGSHFSLLRILLKLTLLHWIKWVPLHSLPATPLSLPSHTNVSILCAINTFPGVSKKNTEKPDKNSKKYLFKLRCSHSRVLNAFRAKKHRDCAFFHETWKSDNGGQNSLGHLSNYIYFLCFQHGVLKKHCYPF